MKVKHFDMYKKFRRKKKLIKTASYIWYFREMELPDFAGNPVFYFTLICNKIFVDCYFAIHIWEYNKTMIKAKILHFEVEFLRP